jgi:hypothetical protein
MTVGSFTLAGFGALSGAFPGWVSGIANLPTQSGSDGRRKNSG